MSEDKRGDVFDKAVVGLLQALVRFLGVYRQAGESERRAALALIRGGLEELGEGIHEDFELGVASIKDGGDTG